MAKSCMLTTFDNPYDPFTQFSLWFLFDVEHEHFCCDRFARIAHTSDQLTDDENEEEKERAIDEIIKNDFLNIYKKVVQENTNDESSDNTTDSKILEPVVS